MSGDARWFPLFVSLLSNGGAMPGDSTFARIRQSLFSGRGALTTLHGATAKGRDCANATAFAPGTTVAGFHLAASFQFVPEPPPVQVTVRALRVVAAARMAAAARSACLVVMSNSFLPVSGF
jgi:hypothetical protein